MNPNPYKTPSATSENTKINLLLENATCPQCGLNEFDKGYVHSTLSLTWHDNLPKFLSLPKLTKSLSKEGLHSGYNTAFKCKGCNCVILISEK